MKQFEQDFALGHCVSGARLLLIQDYTPGCHYVDLTEIIFLVNIACRISD